MFLTLAAILATAHPLPFIDRAQLRVLAKAEARPTRAMSRPRTPARISLADLCRNADIATTNDRSDIARDNSMFGPEVSILKSTCARVSVAGASSKRRLASR